MEKKLNRTMAVISLIFTMVFSITAFAKTHDLFRGDYRLTPLKGRLYSIQSLCPKGARCLVDGTVVKIEFTLLGCQDRLGPVSYEVLHRDNKTVDIVVNAVNIENEKSDRVYCYLKPTHILNLSMVNKFYRSSDIKIHYLQVY